MKPLAEITNVAELREYARQAVAADLAAMDSAVPAVRRGQGDGPSIVFALRIGRDEAAALERRAERLGIGPSVLARNLIRIGLRRPIDERLAAIVEQLDVLSADLRELAQS